TLPMLKVSDLDQRNKPIPIAVAHAHGSTVLHHDLFTNGIAYLEAGFDMRALSAESLPYVPLFGRALLEMGTTSEDYVKLSMRIGRKTGGVGRASLTSLRMDDGALASWFMLRGKATMAHTDDLLAIVYDVLTTTQLDNRERFKQLVLQEKARQEAGLIPSGNAFASSRMRAHFNAADWAAEQMGGISYLFFLRELAVAVENDWPSVLAQLEAIRRALINRRMMLCNVTLDEANWRAFEPKLAGFVASLPASPITLKHWRTPNVTTDGHATHEGLTLPSKVNYVAKGANLYEVGYTSRGATLVATRLLSIGYLHDKVRVMGGAYGGGCSFDRNTGVFGFSSYRDPNLLGTLDNYDGASEFLRRGDITQDELDKNIIGLIGNLDFYQLPDAKGYTSMARYVTGVSDESRQQVRDEILATTIADVRAFADALEHVKRHGTVVVLGSHEAIDAANKERGGWMQVTKVM
ncbi:MAG: peptidase M16, partial [Chloroflexota bacterium]